MHLSPETFWLLVECGTVFVAASVWMFVRHRNLLGRVRGHLARRAAFVKFLEDTLGALQGESAANIQKRIDEHGCSEATARCLEEARIRFVEGALQEYRAANGEPLGFWNGAYGIFNALATDFGQRMDELQNAAPGGATSAGAPADEWTPGQDDDGWTSGTGVPESDKDAGDAVSEPVLEVDFPVPRAHDAEDPESLRRIIRHQASLIERLEPLRHRFDELKIQYLNLRAVNVDLTTHLEQHLRAAGTDADANRPLQAAMVALERANRDFSVCVETLEQENDRLREMAKPLQEAAVESAAATPELRARLEELQREVAAKTEECDGLRHELDLLQGEYTVLFNQHSATQP